MLLWIISMGTFTLSYQELSMDFSSKEERTPQQKIQDLRQLEVQTNVTARRAGKTRETFL